MNPRCWSVVALVLVLTACATPLEFADWTLPVDDGVRVVEYDTTPNEARSGRIELVEDLVLGLDANDSNQAFYAVRDVDADADGNLWVMDGGNHRIQVFDAAGGFVRSLGREGQGPGEFDSPGNLVVVGERVLTRSGRSRFSLFDLAGRHLIDFTVTEVTSQLRDLVAREGGDFLAASTQIDMQQITPGTSGNVPSVFTVARFSLDGAVVSEQVRLESDTAVVFETSASQQRPASVARPFPMFAASRAGDVYVISGEEYQVLAIDPDAEAKWALRVAFVPEALSETIVEEALELARRRRPETTRADLIWPDRMPALAHIVVDGHGHVYVYPYFHRGEELEDRPVDVYSADGELLFAGMIEDRLWRRARGEYVYAAGADRVSGETLVWRWRLVEPF